MSALEGRLAEQGGQAEILSAGLAKVQEKASLERGETQACANRMQGCQNFFAILVKMCTGIRATFAIESERTRKSLSIGILPFRPKKLDEDHFFSGRTCTTAVADSSKSISFAVQEWRKERSEREQELSKKVLELNARIDELEERQRVSQERHDDREKVRETPCINHVVSMVQTLFCVRHCPFSLLSSERPQARALTAKLCLRTKVTTLVE